MVLALLLCWYACIVSANLYPSSGVGTTISRGVGEGDKRQPVLVLDIDGTLYDDDCKIETQIAEGCFKFANQFGYSIADSNDLHRRYGSTICGICENGQPRSTYRDYCNDVYPRLDMSKLRKYSASVGDTLCTGYSEDMASALRSLEKFKCPIVIASNSPTYHVKRVLSRLGLAHLPVQYIITPERRGGLTKAEPKFWEIFTELFPPSEFVCTLVDDNALNIKTVRSMGFRGWHINKRFSFADSLLHFLGVFPSSPESLVSDSVSGRYQDPDWLNFDAFKFDSAQYLRCKNQVDCQSFNPLVRAALVDQLALSFDATSKVTATGSISPPDYTNPTAHSSQPTRLVVDVGAGLLHMLPEVADIVTKAYQQSASLSASSTATPSLKLVYIAFESNADLNTEIRQSMHAYGLKTTSGYSSAIGDGHDHITSSSIDMEGTHMINGVQTHICVHVYNTDAMSEEALRVVEESRKRYTAVPASEYEAPARQEVDLIVGSCVADLIPPRRLVSQVVEMANDHPSLLYLPITFIGKTSLHRVRPSPAVSAQSGISVGVASGEPVSDDSVFDMYHKHLRERGHHMDPSSLLHELLCYGCYLIPPSSHFVHSPGKEPAPVGFGQVDKYLQQSSSSWNISPFHHPYMWQSMMRFLALGVAFQSMTTPPYRDVTSWFLQLQREAVEECNLLTHQHSRLSHGADHGDISSNTDDEDDVDRLVLVASNVDILARLPRVQQYIHADRAHAHAGDATGRSDADSEFRTYFGTQSLDELKVATPFQPQLDSSIEQFNRAIRRELSLIRDFKSSSVKATSSSLLSDNTTNDVTTTTIDSMASPPSITAPSSVAIEKASDAVKMRRCMVEFAAPGRVHVVLDQVPPVGPDQVLVKSVCSLVSTGTELKVFSGELDSTQPADTTIKGLAAQSLGYPLRYGYSMVGEVIESKDSREGGLKPGDRVFSFSPHGSHHVLDASGAMKVPDGISAADATFLPSVETAVSLVMKAVPMIGERVGVVGAGLIGILTAQVLQKTGVDIVLVDVRDDRLLLAASVIPDITLYNPLTRTVTRMKNHAKQHSYVFDESSTEVEERQGLDQSLDAVIEVSGTAGGLNTAVSLTRDSGRIVLGSWYGDRPLPVILGTRFHRSHIQLVSSQVSTVPADLSARWSKARRFDLAWETLRQLQPTRLFLSSNTPSNSAANAGNIYKLMSSCVGNADVDSITNSSEAVVSTLTSDSSVVQSVYEALKGGLQLTALFEYQ